ncbi:MAG: UxaA family hydrolase, partial [Thermomicrobiales bacterium]
MTTNLPRAESVQFTPAASRVPVPLNDVAVILHEIDQVAIAKTTLLPGTKLILADGSELRVSQLIPTGHKIALRAIEFDEAIRKYGQIIGFATQPVLPGQHVHSQNLA